MNYLEMLAYGSASNNRINKLKYGIGKKTTRLWQVPKVEGPFFVLTEDDLP